MVEELWALLLGCSTHLDACLPDLQTGWAELSCSTQECAQELDGMWDELGKAHSTYKKLELMQAWFGLLGVNPLGCSIHWCT